VTVASGSVLVTRPEPAASETAVRLKALGFDPVISPCIAVRIMPAKLPPPEAVQAVLVTSANALPALPPSYEDLPLLAVGDATAAHARAAGFHQVQSAAADAAALAQLAARRCDPAGLPLLLAAGEGHGEALQAALRAAGFAVLHRTVYATGPAASFPPAAAAALGAGLVAAALFLSAGTARAFAGLLPQPLRPSLATVDALAIASSTAAPLRALPWRQVRIAVHPTLEAVLALL